MDNTTQRISRQNTKRLFKGCNCYLAPSTKPHHYHDEYEVLFVVDGHADLMVQGREYSVCAGDLTVISRYEEHTIFNKDENYKCYYLLIYTDTIDEIIGDKTLSSVFKNRDENFTHVMEMTPVFDEIAYCFEAMKDEFSSNEPYADEAMSLMLKSILIMVYRRYPNAFRKVNSQLDEEIGRIQELIDINCTDDLKIREIADEFYVSPQYLSKAFKKRTGYSPKQYLTKIRISRAKSLLVNSNAGIQEIAYSSGFGDESNFIRVFKKYEGTSPNKYRRSNKSGGE